MEFLHQLKIRLHLLHFGGVVGEFGGKRLQRGFDSGGLVKTAEDYAHAAAAELRQHFVATQDQAAGSIPSDG
ncbi:hypothetical protein SDC9_106637 [bioreactor metagenome]|uniref:Uncharacterized protein n=1 Tax=bioreactor metagenome TaxID=1076179 RepID=A0A645B5A8_9ZZZZ